MLIIIIQPYQQQMSVGADVLQVGRATKRSLEEERIQVSPASAHHQN